MSDCIEWTGHITKSGYGMQYSPETKQSARSHRVSYCTHHGLLLSDIEGKHVLHTCDNRKCVNPEHLYLGDHAQNMKDKVERSRSVRGSACAKSKLTEDQVRAIREEYQPGVRGKGQRKLAQKYGVSQASIQKIVTGKDWSWL